MQRLLLAGLFSLCLIIYYFYKTNETKVIQPEKKVVKTANAVKKVKTVSQKKKDFYALMVTPLNEVYEELEIQYNEVKALIDAGTENERIERLKKKYKVDTNQKLLYALKPHPKSIAIAQGAMESAWGTSRFYEVAYNIFGVWSFNKNDKRVAAGETRGTKTIWLKKYDSAKESIEDYYLTMSRSSAFKAFKKLNHEQEHQNPYLLVKKLDRYSEKGALYGKELASMISYNDFTKYDVIRYAKPVEKIVKKEINPVQEENKLDDEVKVAQVEIEEKSEELKTEKTAKAVEVIESIQENENSFENIVNDIKTEENSSKKDITKE